MNSSAFRSSSSLAPTQRSTFFQPAEQSGDDQAPQLRRVSPVPVLNLAGLQGENGVYRISSTESVDAIETIE